MFLFLILHSIKLLDKERYLYPLPLEYYTDLKVRKYGAHGTSHKYVSQQVALKC